MQVTKFNLVIDLQIMLSNVTHSNFYFECNTERGSIDQLYIELGKGPGLGSLASLGAPLRHYAIAKTDCIHIQHSSFQSAIHYIENN